MSIKQAKLIVTVNAHKTVCSSRIFILKSKFRISK